jgi:hypothetical protein
VILSIIVISGAPTLGPGFISVELSVINPSRINLFDSKHLKIIKMKRSVRTGFYLTKDTSRSVDCFILQGSTKRGDHLDYLKNDLSSHSAL